LEQHHYLLASDYAVEQIKTIYEHLTKPPTVQAWCTKKIPVIRLDTKLNEVIDLLVDSQLPALPVRDKE
jgi:CBS domain-containing protein